MGIPRNELVGQNPRMEDGVYIDDYMTALNKFATVDEVFGEYRQSIADGDQGYTNYLGWYVGGDLRTPLTPVITASALHGEWRAAERGKNFRISPNGLIRGFVLYQRHEDIMFILPSAHYLTHCQQRISNLPQYSSRRIKKR